MEAIEILFVWANIQSITSTQRSDRPRRETFRYRITFRSKIVESTLLFYWCKILGEKSSNLTSNLHPIIQVAKHMDGGAIVFVLWLLSEYHVPYHLLECRVT